ncbi:MAG TPA: MFS transporter, partial [Kofleriaceae bacterium]|nr:MFS transporter [Kofleriaceae bacterium]
FVPIFMLFQQGRGLSFFERLALGGIYSAVIIIVEVPTGVLADRLGRRRAMIWGAIAMVASCLLATRAHGFVEFAVAESLAALSMALISGADSAYLYDLLAAHDRQHEYPRRESAASGWHLLGSACAFAGGGALASVHMSLPYLVTGSVAAIAAIVAALLEEDVVPARSARAWGRQTIAALEEVARNGKLAWLVGYSAVVFALVRATIYVYQPYLAERGLSMLEIGLLFAGVNLVASVVSLRTYRLRATFGDDRLLWGLLAILVISFIGLASAGAGPWMLALLVVQAIASGIYSPLTKPLLNREIRSQNRAAVLSVESMARRAAIGVFAPLVGLFGQGDVMLLCGAAGIGGLVILAFARLRLRNPLKQLGKPAD